MSISSVTSEALQLKLRQLLPSQQGFGTDLSASDTIVPVIDLTGAAEGSDVGQNLQTALAFGSANFFNAQNSTVTIANTAGFYRVFGNVCLSATASTHTGSLKLSDGVTTNFLTYFSVLANGGAMTFSFDFVVFLASGESITAESSATSSIVTGSSRQIADVNGVLVQPSGFNPQ